MESNDNYSYKYLRNLLENVDMDLLLNFTQRDGGTVPFWSLKNLLRRQEQDYYEFEVIAEEINENEEQGDVDEPALDVCEDDTQQSPTDFNEYKCHICNIDVPEIYVSEHNDSMRHRNNILLVKSALERVNKQIGEPLLKSFKAYECNAEHYFCEPCVKVINNRDKEKHEYSRKHAGSVKYDDYLRKFTEIFMESDPELLLKKIQNIDSVETSVNAEVKETYNNTGKNENILHRLSENDVVRLNTDQTSSIILRVPTLSIYDKIHEKTSMVKDNETSEGELLFSHPDTKTTNSECEEQTERLFHYQMKETENPKQLLCTVCKVKVPNATFNIYQHIESLKHTSKLASSNIQDTVCEDYIPQRDSSVHSCIRKDINFVKNAKNKIANPNLKNITEKPSTKQNVKLPTVNATNNDSTKVDNIINVKESISIVGTDVDGRKVKDAKNTNGQHVSDHTIVKNKGNQIPTEFTSVEYSFKKLFELSTSVVYSKQSIADEDNAFKKHIMLIKKWYPVHTHDVSVTGNNEIRIETFFDGKTLIVPVDNFNGYSNQTPTFVNCKLCGVLLYSHEAQQMHKSTPIHSRNVMSEIADMHCIRKYKNWNHCVLCNETVNDIDTDDHKNSQEHASRLEEALVTKLDFTEASNNEELIVNTSITKDKEIITSDATKINDESEENKHTEIQASNISYDKRTNDTSSDIYNKSHSGEQNNSASNEKCDLLTAPNNIQETDEIMVTVNGQLKRSTTFCKVCNLTILDNDLGMHLSGKKHFKALNKLKTVTEKRNEGHDNTVAPLEIDDKRYEKIGKANTHRTEREEENKRATTTVQPKKIASTIGTQAYKDENQSSTNKPETYITHCEVCNSDILVKDLTSHLKGKKHGKALSKLGTIKIDSDGNTVNTIRGTEDKLNYQLERTNTYTLTCKICDTRLRDITVEISKHLQSIKHRVRYEAILDDNRIKVLDNGFFCDFCKADVYKTRELDHIKCQKHKLHISTVADLDKIPQIYCRVCKILISHISKIANHELSTDHISNRDFLMRSNKIVPVDDLTCSYCEICQEYVAEGFEVEHLDDPKHTTNMLTTTHGEINENYMSDEQSHLLEEAVHFTTTKTSMTNNGIDKSMTFEEYIDHVRSKFSIQLNFLRVINSNYIEIEALDGLKLEVPYNNFHGFIEVTPNVIQCRVCKSFVSEELTMHKFTIKHMIRIAMEIKDKHCVRQLDANWSHCLLCNITMKHRDVSRHGAEDKSHSKHLKQALLPDMGGDMYFFFK